MPSFKKYTPPVCVFSDFAGWVISLYGSFCNITLQVVLVVVDRMSQLNKLVIRIRFSSYISSYVHFPSGSSQWRCSSNYLFCSCQEAKYRHVARKLKMFEEHLLGGVFLFISMACFRIFLVEHLKILPGNKENFSQIFLQSTSLSVKQTEVFVNYMKNSSSRTPPGGEFHYIWFTLLNTPLSVRLN